MNKPTTAMKLSLCALALGTAAVQAAQFFRIAGPTATTITAFRPDGTLVWSNAQPGATYTIQTVSSLRGGTNWVDYIQIPATNRVNTNLLIAFHPPAGMALIPGGVFTMGDTLDGDSDAIPTTVYVSAFYMDVNLVSYSQWKTVYNWATNHGYGFYEAGAGKAANHPVYGINWYDMVKWCNARSENEGRVPAYYMNSAQMVVYRTGDVDVASAWVNWSAGYRLPTEAEWEKAARGGLIGKRFPWGYTISASQANYHGDTYLYSFDLGPNGYNPLFDAGAPLNNQPYTSPVGYFAPNGYGLYDMAGNAWEYCWDWYGTPYGQPTTTNPTGPASSLYGARVLRGGSWGVYAWNAACASRYYGPNNPADVYDDYKGFRCVRGF
jgi:formylglycine-generating enzyme required for sulfatase activity